MWEKPFRYAVIAAIYGELFWQELDEVGPIEPDFAFYLEQTTLAEGFVFDEVKAKNIFNRYLDNKEEMVREIKPYFQNWLKTYNLVKAILFAFILEKVEIEQSSGDIREIVGKYIRITQDLVGGKNTALVHAILSKMTGQEVPPIQEE